MNTTLQDKAQFGQQAGKGYTYFVSFVAAIGGFLFGYDLAIIAGAQIFLRDYFHLNPGQYGFATSSAILGCILGPTLGASLSDRVGRKVVLLTAGLLFIAGALGTALPSSIAMFNVFRILGGVGVGLASLASPMYIAEISPAKNRGRLGLMYQLAITVGALAATLVSYFLARGLAPDLCWRWMFASIIVPILIFLVLLAKVPQSPRWLAGKGRDDEAHAILTKINGHEQADIEMREIRSQLSEESGSLAELFGPGVRLALITGILLAVFNNWTGWSGVAYYLPTIFQMGGYADPSKAIGVALVPMTANILFTFVAIWLVDKVGRRPLWIATSAAMVVALIAMGLVFHHHVTGPIIVVMSLLILAPHAIGLGGLPWLMMSELFPTRIRARAVSVTTTFLWFAGFTGPLAFPKLVAVSNQHIGSPAGIFWMYAVVAFAALIFGIKMLPETKGRTLESIARSWEKKDH